MSSLSSVCCPISTARLIYESCDANASVVFLVELFTDELKVEVVPLFESSVLHSIANSELTTFISNLCDIFNSLHDLFERSKSNLIEFVQQQDEAATLLLIRMNAVLFHTISPELSAVIHRFFSESYVAFVEDHDASSSHVSSFGDEFTKFIELISILKRLNLFERLASDVISHIMLQVVDSYVGEFQYYSDTDVSRAEEWADSKLKPWIKAICGDDVYSGSVSLALHINRVLEYLYLIYGGFLVTELFSMIIDFPSSRNAVLTLADCLRYGNSLRTFLIDQLKQALNSRLLHPGVNTSDILTAYIQAIKTLRCLDPTGVILDLVSLPIRHYLRNRSDTVRCIVTYMTEDIADVGNESEMYQGGLSRADDGDPNETIRLNDSYQSEYEISTPAQCNVPEGSSMDADSKLDAKLKAWEPEPIDADPYKDPKSRKSADVITLLVGIYGSKELFVKEYCQLLAERLLKNYSFEVEKEIKYLELLKLRFGESELHQCEVMINDIQNSARINLHITSSTESTPPPTKSKSKKSEKRSPIPVSSLVLSAQFWPELKKMNLELPKTVDYALNKFCTKFEQYKPSRTLEYKTHVGGVELELDIKGSTLCYSVTPLLACIIWKFQENEKWSLDDLSSELEIAVSVLKRRIGFWQSQGVIVEESSSSGVQYALVSEFGSHMFDTNDDLDVSGVAGPSKRVDLSMDFDEEEDNDDSMLEETTSAEMEFEEYWSYIRSLLRHLESTNVDRIHSVLKMLCQGKKSEPSVSSTKKFLDRKVKEKALIMMGASYMLPKQVEIKTPPMT